MVHAVDAVSYAVPAAQNSHVTEAAAFSNWYLPVTQAAQAAATDVNCDPAAHVLQVTDATLAWS